MEPSESSEPNMALYGQCEDCGSPRAIRTTTLGEDLLVELVCQSCGLPGRLSAAGRQDETCPRCGGTTEAVRVCCSAHDRAMCGSCYCETHAKENAGA